MGNVTILTYKKPGPLEGKIYNLTSSMPPILKNLN